MTRHREKTVHIVGVPMDLGQQRRGVDMGPSALRYAGLYQKLTRLGWQVQDGGNILVPDRNEVAVRVASHDTPQHRPMGHLAEVRAVCSQLYDLAQRCASRAQLPIFLGGDHSLAMGTVAGMTAQAHVGLLWIDAHGDFNTPQSSPSGNIHGMPVAALTGQGHPDLVNLGRPGPKIDPAQIVMIGIRDLDSQERVALQASAIRVYTMRDVDEQGMAAVARAALEYLGPTDHLHISLDMDVMDPSEAPGVGTPVPGGLTFREAHLLMEILAESGKVGSADVVEINPILDRGNTTSELAVALLSSMLGQRIL